MADFHIEVTPLYLEFVYHGHDKSSLNGTDGETDVNRTMSSPISINSITMKRRILINWKGKRHFDIRWLI